MWLMVRAVVPNIGRHPVRCSRPPAPAADTSVLVAEDPQSIRSASRFIGQLQHARPRPRFRFDAAAVPVEVPSPSPLCGALAHCQKASRNPWVAGGGGGSTLHPSHFPPTSVGVKPCHSDKLDQPWCGSRPWVSLE